jgi:HPt (histidine-containing phosphotransfer) domain-containing protein
VAVDTLASTRAGADERIARIQDDVRDSLDAAARDKSASLEALAARLEDEKDDSLKTLAAKLKGDAAAAEERALERQRHRLEAEATAYLAYQLETQAAELTRRADEARLLKDAMHAEKSAALDAAAEGKGRELQLLDNAMCAAAAAGQTHAMARGGCG